jgi:hypothetical protein
MTFCIIYFRNEFSAIIRRFAQIYSRQQMLKPRYLLNYLEKTSSSNAHASFYVDSILPLTPGRKMDHYDQYWRCKHIPSYQMFIYFTMNILVYKNVWELLSALSILVPMITSSISNNMFWCLLITYKLCFTKIIPLEPSFECELQCIIFLT